jgi:ribosomal-protein-alanine N-acetyltransferase
LDLGIFPTIETKNLILRQLQEADVAQMAKLANNENVSKYTEKLPYPYYEKDARKWIQVSKDRFNKRKAISFAISLNELLIGCIAIRFNNDHNRAKISIWLGKEYWSQGHSVEASEAVIKYCFESLYINKICAFQVPENDISEKLILRLGFVKEGLSRDHFCKNGAYKDAITYGILRRDYLRESD